MKIEELKQGNIFNMFYGHSLEKARCLYNDIREKRIGYELLDDGFAGSDNYMSYKFDNFESLNSGYNVPVKTSKFSNYIDIVYYVICFMLGIFLAKIF